jgi:hypothetical protein
MKNEDNVFQQDTVSDREQVYGLSWTRRTKFNNLLSN